MAEANTLNEEDDVTQTFPVDNPDVVTGISSVLGGIMRTATLIGVNQRNTTLQKKESVINGESETKSAPIIGRIKTGGKEKGSTPTSKSGEGSS